MTLAEYLRLTENIVARKGQQEWFQRLHKKASQGQKLFRNADADRQRRLREEVQNRIRTEELKAWYSMPENGSLFQGTSISSLTIPEETKQPLRLGSITDLEEAIADAYIRRHRRLVSRVRKSIMENVDQWIAEGLFYGVVIGSKLLAQAFGLAVAGGQVVMNIDGRTVDPHEILSYPEDIRREYFQRCAKSLEVYSGLGLEQRELESSLVLADVSKPKIRQYRDKILLAPVRCNELAAIMAERVTELIIAKTGGAIRPRGLAVVIYDTDTPYTYHKIMGFYRDGLVPVLPGLIVLGASGTSDAFRWLYTYRVSLIAQKMMKSSVWSEAQRSFIPFVFFGVLVPRDAEILLELDRLSMLRYRGNLDPEIECSYVLPDYAAIVDEPAPAGAWKNFLHRHRV